MLRFVVVLASESHNQPITHIAFAAAPYGRAGGLSDERGSRPPTGESSLSLAYDAALHGLL
jgi:hypothetical protein